MDRKGPSPSLTRAANVEGYLALPTVVALCCTPLFGWLPEPYGMLIGMAV